MLKLNSFFNTGGMTGKVSSVTGGIRVVTGRISTMAVVIGLLSILIGRASVFAAAPETKSASQVEDWKGASEKSELTVGGLTGMGIVDNAVGLAVLGTVSKKIVKRGFVPDVNDSVSIEAYVGPMLFSTLSYSSTWIYSLHLRWDFAKDDQWTFYAVGGAGGNIVSYNVASSVSATSFRFFPRFGIGAFYKVTDNMFIRAEVAHDGLLAGVNFRF